MTLCLNQLLYFLLQIAARGVREHRCCWHHYFLLFLCLLHADRASVCVSIGFEYAIVGVCQRLVWFVRLFVCPRLVCSSVCLSVYLTTCLCRTCECLRVSRSVRLFLYALQFSALIIVHVDLWVTCVVSTNILCWWLREHGCCTCEWWPWPWVHRPWPEFMTFFPLLIYVHMFVVGFLVLIYLRLLDDSVLCSTLAKSSIGRSMIIIVNWHNFT